MSEGNGHSNPPTVISQALRAVERIPSGVFILTAEYEQVRMGLKVRWVQLCGREPLHVTMSVPKGHPISPIVRDAHVFGLCQLSDDNRYLARKFERDLTHRRGDDPFVAMEIETLVTGAPLIKRALCALDCEVRRHIDFDSDHELYIAEVVAGRIGDESSNPAVRWGDLPSPLSLLPPTIGP